MLELLNRYSHGLVSIPFLHALRARGCLARLAEVRCVSAEQLARDFSANRGYFDVALRMLVCLGWIRPSAEGGFQATAELTHINVIPDQIMDLCLFPFDSYIQGQSAESLHPWLERSEQRWNSEHPYLPDYLDGLLLIPLLQSLRNQGRLDIREAQDDGTSGAILRMKVDSAVRRGIEDLFIAKKWASRQGEELRLNRAGRFVIDRMPVTATVASYRPMLGQSWELLFGRAKEVFALGDGGHERHVERTLNVIGSGFQHEKYFAALSDLVLPWFNHEDFSAQPKYIVDMGCGDGSLLRRLYENVRDRTRRGKVLGAHPLIAIAVDFNEKALREASRTLDGIEHIAIQGDIGNPVALIDSLRARGVEDVHRMLHVRSFLDHNRPYRACLDRDAARKRPRLANSGIHIDEEGKLIPLGDMVQNTVEHLRRWAQIANDFGFVVLEVHSLAPALTARYLDESESFHFDAYHALSHQYLLEANTFLACAAEAGLFCGAGRCLGFPKHLPFNRITLNHFEKRPYVVRPVRDEDALALEQLEQVWALTASGRSEDKRETVRETFAGDFGESAFLLECEGRVQAYVRSHQGETIRLESAHERPGASASHLRDLLQFIEQYWDLAGVGPITGIEACRATLSARQGTTSLADSVACEMRARVARYPFATNDDPRRAELELGAFSFRWLLANLQRMGVMRRADETYSIDALKRRLGVAAKYYRYFDALMRRLHDEGLVVVRGDCVATTPLVGDYAIADDQILEFRRYFQERYPASVGLMNLTACCLARYEEILTGRIDIAEVLFHDAGHHVFQEVFRGDVVSDFFNRIVAETIEVTVARLKGMVPRVRILEIGAGTGGTTQAILRVLQTLLGFTEFCFSDISLSFIRSAQRRFGNEYPWVEYRPLNIEEDLTKQGFVNSSFDIIVAANVLHDTRDIEFTLQQIRGLLKPGGLLLLNEYTSVKDCLTFSGALLHGWWLFEDPERRQRDSCLMSLPQWQNALKNSGFSLVESFRLPTQSAASECTQSVMLCESSAGAVSFTTARAPARVVAPTKMPSDDRAGRPADYQGILAELVEKSIRTILSEARASAFHAQRPLMEMGLDSIELVELKALLEQRFDIKLSPTFFFDHETPEKVVAALATRVSLQQLQKPSQHNGRGSGYLDLPDAKPKVRAEQASDTVAIVGVACRFPGGASSPDAFWKLLERGGHGIVSLPADRWRWPGFVEASSAHKGIDRGGFLHRIDEFDASFFRISPREARLMDPQQRLLLELSWDVLEHAGHRASELVGRKVGVFVGVCHADYRDVLTANADASVLEAYAGSGSAHSLLSNRISYFYDFKGPSKSVDTACSSSLFALHDAVSAIRRGECEQALVGAVNLLSSPVNSIAYYQAGMLSPSGVCRAFDAAADGFVRGEGGAMLLLKPLGMALADGDQIYGLVKGTAVNHGGQAASLTAPKPEAQADAIEAAWNAADVDPESVAYIEAHGTGTRLGDPVEVVGLIEAFRRLYNARGAAWPAKPHCALGSAKSNVGHLEGAAGLAGIIKVLLAMQNRSIPATLNFTELNPDIDLTGSPFFIASGNVDWPRRVDQWGWELPRRSGVSSFGFGGANAHAVIEEYPLTRSGFERENFGYLIPLSAKSAEQLMERGKGLLEFLESTGGEGRLSAVAYTLQVGREPMAERVAFVVHTMEELKAALRAYLAGGRMASNCYRGHAELDHLRTGAPQEGSKEFESIGDEELGKLASLWVRGLELDWNSFYGDAKPHRIGMPTYPFAKERYWIGRAAGEQANGKKAATVAILHPLLHVNTSDLEEQRFNSIFTGEEFFLADHRIQGQHLLPAAAYLEMVREAVTRSMAKSDRPGQARTVRIKNLVWLRPLIVEMEPVEVHLSLFPRHGGEVDFAVYSRAGATDRTIHAQGVASLGAAIDFPQLDVAALTTRYQRNNYSAEACYAAFADLGIVYGAGHRGIEGVHVEGDEALARLSLPIPTSDKDLVLHPGVIDSGLQAIIGFALASGKQNHRRSLFLPFELQNADFYGACTPKMWAVVRRRAAIAGGDAECYDIELCDEEGRICARLHGLTMRVAETPREGAVLELLEAQQHRQGKVVERTTQQVPQAEQEPVSPADRRRARFSSEMRAPAPEPAEPLAINGMGAMWARICQQNQKYDIDLSDEYGCVSVRFRGWTEQPLKNAIEGGKSLVTPAEREVVVTPVWEAVAVERDFSYHVPAGSSMVVIGGTNEQRRAIQTLYTEAKYAEVDSTESVESIGAKIGGFGKVGHLVWIVPQHLTDAFTAESVISEQRNGVLQGFRLIKAMLAGGYGDRALTWTVLTTGVESVRDGEGTNPTHASVHGLMGVVANEYSNWRVRLIDLPRFGDWPWEDVFAVQGGLRGNVLVYRDGCWYQQQLVPYRLLGDPPLTGCAEEVYVIIGGHGGIGSAWSEILLRRSRAQLVWIGRRPIYDVLKSRLERLAEFGPTPFYISADVTDLQELERACAIILNRFGRIDGLVHAAMVLQDQSLERMTEDGFRNALRPKIDGCVRLAQVFGKHKPRFFLFFSSLSTFIKSAGQSNYVAGCMFEDSFARRMAAEWPCRVRVINWGYWGSTGAAADQHYRSLMAKKGLGSIELVEASRILDELLCGRVVQMVYLKTNQRGALPGIDVRGSEWMTSFRESPATRPVNVERIGQASKGIEWTPSADWNSGRQELDRLVTDLLWFQLQSLGLFGEKGASCDEAQMSGKIGTRFKRWLTQSIRLLETGGYLAKSGGQLNVLGPSPADSAKAWERWEHRKSQGFEDRELSAGIKRVEAALRALPEILTERRSAGEVLFMDSAVLASIPAFVNEILGGPVVHFCNAAVARTVVEYLDERRRGNADCQICILELGAGTSGTTEAVLDAIQSHAGCLQEYACANISQAILSDAKGRLHSGRASLNYFSFDVERSPEAQGIAPGSYDLVIADSVLYTAKDIHRALRNVKAVLKANGLLLLHELAANTTLNHVTVGLLDAWWDFSDVELRMPGGPAIEAGVWKAVLQQEGFGSVLCTAEKTGAYGRQIIVSESNGVVRQCLARPAFIEDNGDDAPVLEPRQVAGTPAFVASDSLRFDEIMSRPRQGAIEQILARVRLRTVEVLGLDIAKLDLETRPFADMLLGELGMDSLSANDLRNVLRQELGVDIPAQRIIGEKVSGIVEALYDELLIRRVSSVGDTERCEDRETFVI